MAQIARILSYNKTYNIIITQIGEDLSFICAQKIENFDLLKNMCMEADKLFKDKRLEMLTIKPIIGGNYFAKANGHIFRIKVLFINEGSGTDEFGIEYVDFGYFDIINLSKMYRMPNQFKIFKPFSAKFFLKEKPYKITNNIKIYYKSLLRNKKLTLKLHGQQKCEVFINDVNVLNKDYAYRKYK